MNIFKRILSKFRTPYQYRSSDCYVDWLRRQGVKIGDRCLLVKPRLVQIDTSIPDLLEIGNDVHLNAGLTIMTHDWAGFVFLEKYNDYVPSHAAVKIGNNVWFGRNCTVLKGVTIGDNVIIGACSVVTKSIPANTVAVGSPAKVVCTLEEYYKKRKQQSVQESIDFALEIYRRGRKPVVADFYDDYPAFVDGHNYQDYPYNYYRQFSDSQFEQWKLHSKAPFDGFEAFMKEVDRQRGLKAGE